MSNFNEITDYQRGGNHAKLIERVNQNLIDYHDMLDGFGKRELIEMAGKIAAMREAYDYITTFEHFDDEDVEFLMKFQSPLEIVADGWCEYNMDNDSNMIFSFNNIVRQKQEWLESYPLMSDITAPLDPTLRRYMDIDLGLYLGRIAKMVIVNYPNDFVISEKTFHRAAISDNPEDKRLMWQVCSYGCNLHTERDTFIKDTGAFSYWTDYRSKDEGMFGYVVEVTGYDGGVIKGNVFEVGDYYAHSLYVRENALFLDSVSLTYSDAWGVNAGKTVTVSRFEYDEDRHRLMSESGNVTAIRYHPSESVKEMSEVLRHERAKRMALPIGSTGELISKVCDKLREVRAESQIAEQAAVQRTPRTLQEKMQATNEKVKSQESNTGDPKLRNKREERD